MDAVDVIQDPHHLPLLGGGTTPRLVAVGALLPLLRAERETRMLWIQGPMDPRGVALLRPLHGGVVLLLEDRRLLTEGGDGPLPIPVVVGRGRGRHHPHLEGLAETGPHRLQPGVVVIKFEIEVHHHICVLEEIAKGERRRI